MGVRWHRFGISRVALTCLLLAGLAGVQACKKEEEPDAAALVTVQAEHPETGAISEHIEADATLSPVAQAAITPRITAPVKRFLVQRGSKVKAGQLVAVLENRDLEAQVLDSKGQFESARASYDIATKTQLQQDYKKAELDVAQAKAQLVLQEQIVAARKKLVDEGAIAGRDYDTAAAALVQMRAAYDVAENHLQGLARVSRKAQVEQAQGQLVSARGRYMGAEAQVGYSEIHSPISGVVTDRPLFAGETVSSGSTLMTIMDTSSLLAKVHLAQTAAQRLHVGDAAEAKVPGMEEPVPAKVSLISPALDPGSTTVEVWLKVENKEGRYKAGTPVQVSMAGRTVERALKVPLAAVVTGEDGSKWVMVVGADGVAHKRAVELGIRDGEDVQVMKGLTGSDLVVTTGAYGLDDGTKVKVGKPDAEGEER